MNNYITTITILSVATITTLLGCNKTSKTDSVVTTDTTNVSENKGRNDSLGSAILPIPICNEGIPKDTIVCGAYVKNPTDLGYKITASVIGPLKGDMRLFGSNIIQKNIHGVIERELVFRFYDDGTDSGTSDTKHEQTVTVDARDVLFDREKEIGVVIDVISPREISNGKGGTKKILGLTRKKVILVRDDKKD